MTVAMRSSVMRPVMGFDRRRAIAQIAAAIAFGGRGRQQQLLAGNMPHQPLVPSAAAPVPRDARHLGLMHRRRSSRSRRRRARACSRHRQCRRCSHPRRRTHLESPRPRDARRARRRSPRPARGNHDRQRRHARRRRPRRVRRAPPELFFRPRRAACNVQVPGRPAGRGSGMFGRWPRAHRCTHRYLT